MGGGLYGFKETSFFSYDPLDIVGLKATTAFTMLQIAFFLGFERILIVGLDHHYPKGEKKHFYKDSDAPEFEVAPGPVYDNDTNVWKKHADHVLEMCQEVYTKHGRDIINLTRGSRCEVFRKERLSDWLDNS
jgi:hypothetical protein